MKLTLPFAFLILLFLPMKAQTTYTMPEETAQHEGTWLQWPHNHLYGPFYRSDLEDTWIGMTRALVTGEKVHIIAYDAIERNHIVQALTNANVLMANVDFFIHQNNDCWIRDNGPIFVFDEHDNLNILDWGFDGWGNEAPYALCNVIPQAISSDIGVPKIDLNAMILEGGAFEIDANGTFMATKSSIFSRNPGLTQAQMEQYLATYVGVTKFIWLDGVVGLEITDMHIDGFAKFFDGNTIVCMDSLDLLYWDVPPNDISRLFNATNAAGSPYNYTFLPLTANNVITTWGEHLGYKGSYVNYYVGNTAVLVPTYNDPNDAVAIATLQNLYPGRNVVGIDVRNLYYGGGMIHCVTQQQPSGTSAVVNMEHEKVAQFQNTPNPFSDQTSITFSLNEKTQIRLDVYDLVGKKVATLVDSSLAEGQHTYALSASGLASGIYYICLFIDEKNVLRRKIAVQH